MLPVSGAEQLNTSGAHALRPMISHSGAYSRLVRDPPWSLGCHRFHSPAARALGFSSSTMRVGIQAFPLVRFSSISSKKRDSRGLTCSCMKAETLFCRSLTLSENSKFMVVPCVDGRLAGVKKATRCWGRYWPERPSQADFCGATSRQYDTAEASF